MKEVRYTVVITARSSSSLFYDGNKKNEVLFSKSGEPKALCFTAKLMETA